jgi:tetratricopeptide (TPR) repeat protein
METGSFVLNGEYWIIGYGGATFPLKNILGLSYIHRLLEYPGEEFHVCDLESGSAPGEALETGSSGAARLRDGENVRAGRPGDAGPILDAQAKQDYRRRLLDLKEELDELRERGNHNLLGERDYQKRAEVESEIEALTRQLAQAVGLGGRDRRTGSGAERARLNVTRAIRGAIRKISEQNAALGELLGARVRTGSYCSYLPDADAPIEWRLVEKTAELSGTVPVLSLAQSEPSFVQASAYRTAFVGREEERAALRGYLQQAKNGAGLVVVIGGPPGIGKTRLAREVGEEARRLGFVALAGNCYDREDSVPLVPFVELLEMQLARAASPAAVREVLGAEAPEMTRLLPQLRRLFPDLPAPLQVSPEQSRRMLFNAVGELFVRQSALSPMLLLLEDVHWADEGTLSLLVHLGRSTSTMPVMVIATHRDYELDMKPALIKALEELNRLRVVEQIRLRGLPEGAVAQMIELLSGDQPSSELVELIYSNTNGNPLFVEELIRHCETSGDFSQGLQQGEVALPHNLRLVIGRRLGLLSQPTVRALATAAVIGRSFPFALLEAATRADADLLVDSLEEAEKAGLISSTLQYPEARFEFAHELIRRAVLDEVSVARRQRLHLSIAQAMELLHANVVEEHAADLAHHFWSAGDAADPAKTIRYLEMAGAKAVQSSAFKEAQQSYEQALTLLNRLPESAERDLQELNLRQSIIWLLRITRVSSSASADALARAIALAKKSGNLSQLISLMQATAYAAFNGGDFETAAPLADEALELALPEGNPTNLALVYYLQVSVRALRGDLAGAEEYFARGLKFFEDPTIWPLPVIRLTPLAVAPMNAWLLGRADLARERLARMMAEANQNSPAEVALSGVLAIPTCLALGDYERAEMLAAGALELSEKHKMPQFAEYARSGLGWARARLGRPSEGVALIRQGIAGMAAIGSYGGIWILALAESQALSGAIDQALETIEQLVQRADGAQAEAFRWLGELQTKQGRRDAAEADFRRALALARGMGAKANELRATTSLARLLGDTGRRDEAHSMLAEIYNWFTEGFDTADLKEAKALLEELAT